MSADDIGIAFLLLGRDGRGHMFPSSLGETLPKLMNAAIKEGVLGA